MSGYLKGLDLIRKVSLFEKKYSLTYCKTYLFKTKDLLERHIQKNLELILEGTNNPSSSSTDEKWFKLLRLVCGMITCLAE